MENTTNSIIVPALNNISFWQNIPAAAYVLIGVCISGAFTFFSDKRNIKNNRELKELENKNSREIQEKEIAHQEKLQTLREGGNKALRLLDDRLKVFSDFQNNFSEILISGTDEFRHEKIEKLRRDVYKVELLAPFAKNDLDSLDILLTDYSNFYFKIINKDVIMTKDEKAEGIDDIYTKIKPLINKIFVSLSKHL